MRKEQDLSIDDRLIILEVGIPTLTKRIEKLEKRLASAEEMISIHSKRLNKIQGKAIDWNEFVKDRKEMLKGILK